MFIAGVQGMNRRVSVYLPYLEDINPWISLWAFVLGLAFFVALLNILVAWLRGARASADPWGGTTLEWQTRSEEHTSELQSLMRISYAVFCLKKKTTNKHHTKNKINIKTSY